MKITKIETIWFDKMPDAEWAKIKPNSRQVLPNNTWVRIYTDDGLVGLGETYYHARAVSSIIHDTYAELLMGRDPLNIESHWNNLFAAANFSGFAGSEMRAISAIDVALWDILGQYANLPICSLLGGRMRDRIRIYNTCASYGKFPDNHTWLQGNSGGMAEDLLKSGITALKFWPFDRYGTTIAGPKNPRAPVNLWGGETCVGTLAHSITTEELNQGVAAVADIRRAIGDKMDICVEGHARWDLPSSIRIARALEPYDIFWLEEIMPPDNIDSYVRLKEASSVRICQSERLFTRYAFLPLIEQHAADIIMPDISWCGGLTEAKKITTLADTYYLPVTSHDCIGPVALWTAAHLMLHIPNALIMETVRGYYDEGGWYGDVVDDLPQIADGQLTIPAKPGLGAKFRDSLLFLPNAHTEITTAKELSARV